MKTRKTVTKRAFRKCGICLSSELQGIFLIVRILGWIWACPKLHNIVRIAGDFLIVKLFGRIWTCPKLPIVRIAGDFYSGGFGDCVALPSQNFKGFTNC